MMKTTTNNNETVTFQMVQRTIANMMKINPKSITPNASFSHDLGFDSLDTIDLINLVEQEFHISIPVSEYDINEIKTVNDFVNVIQKQISPKQTYIAPVMNKTIQKTR